MTEIVGAGFGDLVLTGAGDGTVSGHILFGSAGFSLVGSGAGVVHTKDMRLVLTGSATGVVLVAGAGDGALVLRGTVKTIPGPLPPTSAPSGTNIGVLPFAPDWSESVFERRRYYTDIIPTASGREQRRAVRNRADRVFRYLLTGEDPEVGARIMEYLLHMAGQPMAVPAWPYRTQLSGPVAPGEVVLPITGATSHGFHTYALLYRSDSDYELVEVAGVGANDVTTVRPVAGTWPVGSYVVPCYVGTVVPTYDPTWYSRDFLRVPVEIVVRGRDLPTSGASYGASAVNVTLGLFPNRNADVAHASKQPTYTFTAPSYGVVSLDRDRSPVTVQPYEATILDLADAVELWAWFNGRVGRLNPCWVPTFNSDLRLAQDVSSGASTVVIQHCNFWRAFNSTPARRYLALYGGPGSITVRRVTGVSGGGATETLQLSGTAGVNVSATTGYVGFAFYGRLAEDEVEVEWVAPGVGRTRLAFVDVAPEAPAL